MTEPRVKVTLASKLMALAVVQLVLLAIVFMGVGWIAHGMPPELGGSMQPAYGPRPVGLVSPLNTVFVGGLLILGVGSWLTARWIVRPLGELSRVASALGRGELSARSSLTREDEIGDLARTFNEMGGRIEQLLVAEKELLANVSHELRTPLARIRVALEIAGEGDAEAGRASLEEIAVDLAELEALIDDILTTTRLELAGGPTSASAAGFELHLEAIRPDSVCQRAAERFRAKHPQRPLDVAAPPELPPIDADPVLLRRVLDNLLENAHKYSPDAASAITLRAAEAADGVSLAVEDHGMGIAEDDLPRLFMPFFRADRSRTRGTGGVGLGLTLAKRIVDAHAGSIRVTSKPGAGTTVVATIPKASLRADA